MLPSLQGDREVKFREVKLHAQDRRSHDGQRPSRTQIPSSTAGLLYYHELLRAQTLKALVLDLISSFATTAALLPWARYLIPLALISLIWKMGIIVIPTIKSQRALNEIMNVRSVFHSVRHRLGFQLADTSVSDRLSWHVRWRCASFSWPWEVNLCTSWLRKGESSVWGNDSNHSCSRLTQGYLSFFQRACLPQIMNCQQMRKEGIGREGGRKEEGGESRRKKGGLCGTPPVRPGQQLPGKHKEVAFCDIPNH